MIHLANNSEISDRFIWTLRISLHVGKFLYRQKFLRISSNWLQITVDKPPRDLNTTWAGDVTEFYSDTTTKTKSHG